MSAGESGEGLAAAPTFLPYGTPPVFRFGGVKAEAGKQAKEVSKCQPSAGERVKGSHWPGFDRTIVPKWGPRACARGYYPRPLSGGGPEAVPPRARRALRDAMRLRPA